MSSLDVQVLEVRKQLIRMEERQAIIIAKINSLIPKVEDFRKHYNEMRPYGFEEYKLSKKREKEIIDEVNVLRRKMKEQEERSKEALKKRKLAEKKEKATQSGRSV